MMVNLMQGRRGRHKGVASSGCTEGLNWNTVGILPHVGESAHQDRIGQMPPWSR
jgi:hypothetical protein